MFFGETALSHLSSESTGGLVSAGPVFGGQVSEASVFKDGKWISVREVIDAVNSEIAAVSDAAGSAANEVAGPVAATYVAMLAESSLSFLSGMGGINSVIGVANAPSDVASGASNLRSAATGTEKLEAGAQLVGGLSTLALFSIAPPSSASLASRMTSTGLKPTQAAKYFDMNKAQRYAKTMKEGGWDWNRGKVTIDSQNNIMSGHHRFIASEISGLKIPEAAIQRYPGVSPMQVRTWHEVLPK